MVTLIPLLEFNSTVNFRFDAADGSLHFTLQVLYQNHILIRFFPVPSSMPQGYVGEGEDCPEATQECW